MGREYGVENKETGRTHGEEERKKSGSRGHTLPKYMKKNKNKLTQIENNASFLFSLIFGPLMHWNYSEFSTQACDAGDTSCFWPEKRHNFGCFSVVFVCNVNVY